MRLTLQTDYALRVAIYLAEHPDRLCSISEIARAYGISHNHLMKVAHGLGKAGFVASVRGRNGGLRLARPASEITVGAIVREMEDGFTLVDCASCIISPLCGLRGLLGQATSAFLAVLDACSLADLHNDRTNVLALLTGVSSAQTQPP
ncbi:HTH-type transcriptional regulator NsrR [Devosia pacifica]|uniref:HTH-type transcriptional regulator NsrR n=1 Tax=Devosia pacifica TaxID=1335967 RepID=A0A918VY28_9HYPH|nr:Rrf2 family transcriptional regulator [Devosia pacifica]GHA33298.1 HTH-type transcriptional regulator NsrR [Devosia pacifica]